MNTKLENSMLALSLVVLFLSVQSMPIDNNTECYTDNKIIKQNTEKFYCTATMMYNQLQKQNLNVIQPVLSKQKFNTHSVSVMLGVFSDTCKMQITAMMYKYQLEQYITTVGSSDNLYSITAALQNVARVLETIEEASSKTVCVEFAPDQYEMIYTLLYDGQPLLVSLMEQVKTWIQIKDYCHKFGYPIPSSMEC